MADKKFIPALTGIRAIAVYLIFFKHLNFFSPTDYPNLHLFVNQFYTFLTFFFVLSGFLIYHRYHEISGLNRKNLRNYFISRIARVFPILIILISITFFLSYYHGTYTLLQALKFYLLNVTLLKGFSSEFYLTGIGPSWSMSVEELFYILSPLLFLYGKSISKLLVLLLLIYTIGILLSLTFSKYPFHGFFENYIFTSNTTFFGRAFEFFCGIFLGFLVKGKYPNFILHQLGRKTLVLGLSVILTSLILLFLIAKQYQLSHAIETWQGIAVNNILMPIGITILYFNLVYCKSLLQKILASNVMVQLGNCTYSFYLLHTSFVLSYIFKFISTNIFVVFLVMILISFFFSKLVEQPFATYFRNKFSVK